mmetsp:Transcript_1177/g.2987  ORF Transcript_1177/g.2987 Transcript_1177/m.2987 type:complete len:282 (-) Transcript_1177:817-1662(-)
MIHRLSAFNCSLRRNSRRLFRRQYSPTGAPLATSDSELRRILDQFKDGKLTPSESEAMIRREFQKSAASESDPLASPDNVLKSFADIDHTRSSRTGFPEAVFGAGKTPNQIAMILDDMARNFNEKVAAEGDAAIDNSQRAILATRVSSELYESIKPIPLSHGHLVYHTEAQIISMIPSLAPERSAKFEASLPPGKRVVVATAGTTDLPVAEEAAITLEAAHCKVDRIYDVGVAGLHRVIRALPRLQDNKVGCVIVCAGMDGALPSVIGGLVSCPVIAVPTR